LGHKKRLDKKLNGTSNLNSRCILRPSLDGGIEHFQNPESQLVGLFIAGIGQQNGAT
jgi:hypothetical protein